MLAFPRIARRNASRKNCRSPRPFPSPSLRRRWIRRRQTATVLAAVVAFATAWGSQALAWLTGSHASTAGSPCFSQSHCLTRIRVTRVELSDRDGSIIVVYHSILLAPAIHDAAGKDARFSIALLLSACCCCPGLPGGCICVPAASASPTPEPKFFRDARRV